MKVTLEGLRAALLNEKGGTNILPENKRRYFAEVHYDVRDSAIIDFVDAYKTQTKLVSQGKRKSFEMKFRSKKKSRQSSFVIGHKNFRWNDNGDLYCFPKIWKKEIFGIFSEPLPATINHDSRLIMTRDEKFYLSIPIDVPIITKQQKFNAVSLDPGTRIFQTTYDTCGTSYLIGENEASKIDSLAQIATRMRSGIKREFVNGVKRYRQVFSRKERKNLEKAAYKIETRINNMISDIHRKTTKFLCSKYDTVIIPEFRTKQMAEKYQNGQWKRKIGKETTRQMIRWGHYKFRELLRAKGEVMNTNVIIGTEEWTSKTCGNCMWVNRKLEGEKVLKCEKCEHEVHRDVGAARNIMMLNWERAGLKERKMKLVIG